MPSHQLSKKEATYVPNGSCSCNSHTARTAACKPPATEEVIGWKQSRLSLDKFLVHLSVHVLLKIIPRGPKRLGTKLV